MSAIKITTDTRTPVLRYSDTLEGEARVKSRSPTHHSLARDSKHVDYTLTEIYMPTTTSLSTRTGSLMKFSNIIVTAILLLGAQAWWPSISSATDYYVDTNNGTNINSGLLPDNAFADLVYATEQLQPGDTLYLRAGTYYELPFLRSEFHHSGTSSSPITIKSYANETATISSDIITGIKDLSWWTFEGLVFEHSEKFQLGTSDNSLPESNQCTGFTENIKFKNMRFQNSSSRSAIAVRCIRHLNIENSVFDNIRTRTAGVDSMGIVFEYQADAVVISGNHFIDIGADGIHMLDVPGGQLTNFYITDNEFEIQRPHRYRDENGDFVPVDQQPFSNVGENGIDIKQGPGPIVITNNRFHGFSPAIPGQDASGGGGSPIAISQVARGITISNNYFYDNVKHLTAGRGTNPDEYIDRDLLITNNIFEEKTIQDDFDTWTQQGLHIEDASNVHIYNNTFKNLLPDKNRLLLILNKLSNVELYNNIFQNGRIMIKFDGYMGLNADYNAWSGIYNDAVTDRDSIAMIQGIHDVWAVDLKIDWETKMPQADSPLIDAGFPVGITNDFNGSPVTGLAPDIGSIEFQPGDIGGNDGSLTGLAPDIGTSEFQLVDSSGSINIYYIMVIISLIKLTRRIVLI